jgi:hypothetical protein
MPKLKDVINDLIACYGLRENISQKEYLEILDFYNQGEHGKCVAMVRKHFKLSMVKFHVFYVDKNDATSKKARELNGKKRQTSNSHLTNFAEPVMWVNASDNIPLYGTKDFSQLTLILKIRKDMLSFPFDFFLLSLSHEMAHVVLYSTRNLWRHSEKATDILTLTQGFLDVQERVSNMGLVSYLSPTEVTGIISFIRKKRQEKNSPIKERKTWKNPWKLLKLFS